VGTLILPGSGLVYLDANPLIYTVEKHPDYGNPAFCVKQPPVAAKGSLQ